MRKIVTRPAWLICLPPFVSFVVWLIPWPTEIRHGYDPKLRSPLTFQSLSTLLAWYGLIAACATITWHFGRGTEPLDSLDGADDDRVYRYLTWIGAIGVLGMYALVEIQNPGLIFRALAHQTFNDVRNAIPTSAGIQTLRYATILSGAIALHRLIVMRDRRKVHFFNLAMLLGNVLAASRLALIMAVLVFIGLTVVRSPGRKPVSERRRGRWIALGVLLVLVLGVANYSRNANFYRENYTGNPVLMMVGETVAYVGAPFQVSLGTADAMGSSYDPSSHSGRLGRATVLALPTFAAPKGGGGIISSDGGDGPQSWYRGRISVDDSLTTNSVLATEYGQFGIWSFPFMALVGLIGGFLMGHLSRYKSYLVLGSFVIGYCFAETWRTYLFHQGITWFLLLVLFAACAAATRSKHAAARRAVEEAAAQELADAEAARILAAAAAADAQRATADARRSAAGRTTLTKT